MSSRVLLSGCELMFGPPWLLWGDRSPRLSTDLLLTSASANCSFYFHFIINQGESQKKIIISTQNARRRKRKFYFKQDFYFHRLLQFLESLFLKSLEARWWPFRLNTVPVLHSGKTNHPHRIFSRRRERTEQIDLANIIPAVGTCLLL